MQLTAGCSQSRAPGPNACSQSALPCCRQPGNAAAARCSPDTRCMHSTPSSGYGASRTARIQAAARRDAETAAQQDLWSEDLANTSWGEAWAPSEDSQREEPPQIWPEPEEPSGPEALAQNVLALALAAVLALAAGNVLWKLLSVCWALVSAAARYSFVAIVLLVVAVFLQ